GEHAADDRQHEQRARDDAEAGRFEGGGPVGHEGHIRSGCWLLVTSPRKLSITELAATELATIEDTADQTFAYCSIFSVPLVASVVATLAIDLVATVKRTTSGTKNTKSK